MHTTHKTYPGNLVVLYGVNNCGKTTQAKMLVDAVRGFGYESEYVKYPIYDIKPSGEHINDILRSGKKVSPKEMQLWYALNRHQYEEKLIKRLEKGMIVVAEDYIGTGIAWGMAHGVPKDTLLEINKDLYKEDLSILLSGARFTEAKEEDHLHETNDDLMKKSAKVHSELADHFGWTRVDAAQPIEAVHRDIKDIVTTFLEL